MSAPVLFWFDRFDERIGILRTVGALKHSETLCGDDTLEFCSLDVPGKWDRLLWRDPDDGRWREHIVQRTVERTGEACQVFCESSVAEMRGDYIEEKHMVDKEDTDWFPELLAYTRWSLGSIESRSTLHSAIFYHTDVLAALRKTEEKWGSEFEPEIVVGDRRIEARRIAVKKKLGSWKGLRFDYGRNMRWCKRTVLSDEIYTALYGYGAGLPVTDDDGNLTGGYHRKLTFGDINDGIDWVGDDVAREKWGLWNAERTEKMHRFGEVTFPEEDKPYILRESTKWRLKRYNEPKVTYEVGMAHLGGDACPGLGDEVAVVDPSFGHEWRLKARVLKRVRTLGGADAQVTLGNASLSST